MKANPLPAVSAAAILLLGLPASASAQTQAITVDCTAGQKITSALAQGDSRKPLVLTVRGTCTENVTITRDDVTLQGQPGTSATVVSAGAASTIMVRATRIMIDGLTVNGGVNGIMVSGTMDVQIRNCVIQNSAQSGVFLGNGFASVQNNIIQNHASHGVFLRRGITRLANNQILANGGAGVYAELFSAISAEGNTITGNKAQGIVLHGGSQASLNGDGINSNALSGIELNSASQASLNVGNTIASNEYGIYVNFSQANIYGASITSNRSHGVQLIASRADISGTAITGNGTLGAGRGVNALVGSTVVINGSTITNNLGNGLQLSHNGTANIEGSVFQGNSNSGIRIRYGSTIQFAPPVGIAGNTGWGLECVDGESSYVGPVGPPEAISPGCTGF